VAQPDRMATGRRCPMKPAQVAPSGSGSDRNRRTSRPPDEELAPIGDEIDRRR
jgi:hypothetical protein